MRRLITLLVFLIMFTLSAVFAAFNMNEVTVNFYLTSISVPLSVVIVISLILGAIISALALFVATFKLRYDNRRLQRKLTITEQEKNKTSTLLEKHSV